MEVGFAEAWSLVFQIVIGSAQIFSLAYTWYHFHLDLSQGDVGVTTFTISSWLAVAGKVTLQLYRLTLFNSIVREFTLESGHTLFGSRLSGQESRQGPDRGRLGSKPLTSKCGGCPDPH